MALKASIEDGECDALSNAAIAERPPSRADPESAEAMSVPTTAASAPLVRQFVRSAAIRRGAPTEWIDELIIAINEAFSNAVRHGTGHATDDTTVAVSVSDQGLLVELTYRGEPFDVDQRELPDDVFQHSGRGRFLMRQLLDSETYGFQNGRTTLRMFKHL
jgi:anti-sigma regulatory factor (Ser/Thr protein kinase)